MEVIMLVRATGVNDKGPQHGALKSKALKQYVVPSAIWFHFHSCEKKRKTLENMIMRKLYYSIKNLVLREMISY